MSGIEEWEVSVSDGVALVDFEIIAEVQDNDYSWSAEAVLRRKSDGALFFVETGGCSCYGFAESFDVSDLRPIYRFEEALSLLSDPLDRERLKRSRELKDVVYR